jgi:glutamyl-tRNA synthetase
MSITHVVRGDDHISNTPKQLLLYEALGVPAPDFAHVPLILGPDRKRLSKRHGATSVMEYARQGYLPEAMVNFLGLLGWSPGKQGGDRELFTKDELVQAFSLDGISGGNAVFNLEKWHDAYAGAQRDWLQRVLVLLLPRVKRLPDFVEQGRLFFEEIAEYEPAAVRQHLAAPGLAAPVGALKEALERVQPFDEATIEAALRKVAAERGITAGALIHATRVAVTGRAVSPGLFEVLALLGRQATLARLARLVRFLENV